MKNLLRNRFLFYCILAAILTRIISIFIFSDLKSPEMWEFGIIARNLLNGFGYQYPAITTNVPSAHMPPGLPIIYYLFFLLFGDNSFSYILILLFNIIISAVSIIVLYKLSITVYNKTTAEYSSLYASLSPIYIYSSINFNSIVIYQLLIASLFLLYLKIFTGSKSAKTTGFKNKIYLNTVLLGVLTGIFLYFRSEILAFMLLIFIIFIAFRKYELGVLYLVVSIIIIFPWSMRNYQTFGVIVPVTTSFGYNVLMGHGGTEPTESYKNEIASLTEDSTFEIKVSAISLRTAIEHIQSDPYNEFIGIFKKMYHLWVIDGYSSYAKHPLYIIIWIPTLLLFLLGFYFSLKNCNLRKKLQFLSLYIVFSTMLVIVFFNVPRYQVQISFVLVPTAMFGLRKLINRIKGIKNENYDINSSGLNIHSRLPEGA